MPEAVLEPIPANRTPWRTRLLVAFTALVAALLVAAAAELLLGLAFRVEPGADNDRLRLSHIAEVTGWISSSYLTSSKNPHARRLPRSLDAAARAAGVDAKDEAVFLSDPVTRQALTYHPGTGSAYELCATYETAATYRAFSTWNHPAGLHCFRLDATVESYAPPRPSGYWWNGC
jgi:hypothetical protein